MYSIGLKLVVHAVLLCSIVIAGSCLSFAADEGCPGSTLTTACLTKVLTRLEDVIGRYEAIQDRLKAVESDLRKLDDREKTDLTELRARIPEIMLNSFEIFVRRGNDESASADASCEGDEQFIGGSCIAQPENNQLPAIGPIFNNALGGSVTAKSVHCLRFQGTPVRAYAVCMRLKKRTAG